jgi:hypothetical protein
VAQRWRRPAAARTRARQRAADQRGQVQRQPLLAIMRGTPIAARRKSPGSRVPEGFWPIAKIPVSIGISNRLSQGGASSERHIAGAARLVVLLIV